MAGLTDEQKARIRAEEEARAQAEAEERYRQHVRAELEARQQAELEEAYRRQVRAELSDEAPRPAPAPASPPRSAPPTAPRVAPSSGDPVGLGRAVGLWFGAGLLAAGAITVAVIAFTGGTGGAATDGGAPGDERPPDVVARGDGALVAVAPAKWDPAALGFEGLAITPEGAVTAVPVAPVRSLDELKASAEVARAPRRVVPESSLSAVLAAPAKASAPPDPARWDAMLEYAPADTRVAVGVDGAALKGPTFGRRVFDDLARRSGAERAIEGLAQASGIRVPDDVAAGLFVATDTFERDDDAFLLGLAGGFDGRRLATFYATTDPPAQWFDGPPPRVEARHGGVVVGEGFVVLAELSVFQAALRARSGNNASLSPRVGPALREARQAPSAFAIYDLTGELARDLGRELPDLAGATVLVVRADLRDGVAVEARLALADEGAAKRVAMVLEAARASGKEPLLTRALDGARIGTDGDRVVVTRRATDAEAIAVWEAVLRSDP